MTALGHASDPRIKVGARINLADIGPHRGHTDRGFAVPIAADLAMLARQADEGAIDQR